MHGPNLGQVVACKGLASNPPNSMKFGTEKGISKDALPLFFFRAAIANSFFSRLAPHPPVIDQPVTQVVLGIYFLLEPQAFNY